MTICRAVALAKAEGMGRGASHTNRKELGVWCLGFGFSEVGSWGVATPGGARIVTTNILRLRSPARWKRAVQQIGNLRYARNAGFQPAVSPPSSRQAVRPRRECPVHGVTMLEAHALGPCTG